MSNWEYASYQTDIRLQEAWYQQLDEHRMLALLWNDEYETVDLWVPFKWDVCRCCNGKGVHVNPSIDAHGITGDEMRDDPDFHADYLGGLYDVPCYRCKGRRVDAVRNGTNVIRVTRTLEDDE